MSELPKTILGLPVVEVDTLDVSTVFEFGPLDITRIIAVLVPKAPRPSRFHRKRRTRSMKGK